MSSLARINKGLWWQKDSFLLDDVMTRLTNKETGKMELFDSTLFLAVACSERAGSDL